MQLTSGRVLTAAMALAGSVIAAPHSMVERASQVIIGYRTVSPGQATNYNNAGTVTDDGNMISTQIGAGAYTTPNPGGWDGPQNAWYCVILADSDALNRVSKAWVPEKDDDGNTLWYNNGAIDSYIKDLEDSWDPAKTLRMSIISNQPDPSHVQLVIPPGLMNSNGGGMSISASCKQNLADLPTYVVNYDDWQNNIKGNRVTSDD